MCFLTVALVPERSTLSDFFTAAIAIVVSIHTPSEVAVRSVGLNASPLPRLSLGASVRQCRLGGAMNGETAQIAAIFERDLNHARKAIVPVAV